LFSVPLVEIKAIFLHYQNFVFYWLFYIWIHIKYRLWREPFFNPGKCICDSWIHFVRTLWEHIFFHQLPEKKISCWECNIFIKKIK
jgi:hypothetical protein